MIISDKLFKILEVEEGWSDKPYKCPAGKWTIGFGSTYYENGDPVKQNDTKIDKDRGKAIVKAHFTREVYPTLQKHVKVELNQNEFDALADFVYNVGPENFKTSTLLRKLNANDKQGAAAEFKKWNMGGGKVLEGLVRRREKETLLFLGNLKE